MSQKAPFFESRLTHWSGPENIAWVRIDDESSWALLDSGSTIIAVTPEFIKAHSLDISPLSDLAEWFWRISLLTLGLCYHKGSDGMGVRLWQRSSGSSHIRFNHLWFWVPVTLGTTAINWIINVIKDSKIDELLASLNGSRISPLLAFHQAELSIRSKAAENQTMDLTHLNEAVKTAEREWIDTF